MRYTLLVTRYRRLINQLSADSDNEMLRLQCEREWQRERERFEPLVRSVIARFCAQSDIDYGDYLSAAYAGLERALLRATTPFLLAGFARVCIVNAVIDHHRKRVRCLERERLDDQL